MSDFDAHREERGMHGIQADQSPEKLIDAALERSLMPKEQELISQMVKADPELLMRSRLSPSNVDELCRANPHLAVDFLLLKLKSSEADAYFAALSRLEITLNAIEMVNMLACSPLFNTIPGMDDFINPFIVRCISACDNIYDVYQQNRMARIVCIFFQSLANNRCVDMSRMVFELEAFCIGFSRIKEAAALFQYCKALEGDA